MSHTLIEAGNKLTANHCPGLRETLAGEEGTYQCCMRPVIAGSDGLVQV